MIPLNPDSKQNIFNSSFNSTNSTSSSSRSFSAGLSAQSTNTEQLKANKSLLSKRKCVRPAEELLETGTIFKIQKSVHQALPESISHENLSKLLQEISSLVQSLLPEWSQRSLVGVSQSLLVLKNLCRFNTDLDKYISPEIKELQNYVGINIKRDINYSSISHKEEKLKKLIKNLSEKWTLTNEHEDRVLEILIMLINAEEVDFIKQIVSSITFPITHSKWVNCFSNALSKKLEIPKILFSSSSLSGFLNDATSQDKDPKSSSIAFESYRIAVQSYDREFLELLINQSPQVGEFLKNSGRGRDLLIKAYEIRNLGAMELLLKAGAQYSLEKESPLVKAIIQSEIESIEIFSSDFKKKQELNGEFFDFPIHELITPYHSENKKYFLNLLDKLINLKKTSKAHLSFVKWLIDCDPDLLTNLIIKKNINFTFPDFKEDTAQIVYDLLSIAVNKDNLLLAEEIIQSVKDSNISLEIKENNIINPFTLAYLNGKEYFINHFLNFKNIITFENHSPIQCAIQKGDLNFAKRFFESAKKFRVEISLKDQALMLKEAIVPGNLDAVKYLIEEENFSLDICDCYNPLVLSFYFDKQEISQWLIKKNICLNTSLKSIPLMISDCLDGLKYVKTLNSLIYNGADPYKLTFSHQGKAITFFEEINNKAHPTNNLKFQYLDPLFINSFLPFIDDSRSLKRFLLEAVSQAKSRYDLLNVMDELLGNLETTLKISPKKFKYLGKPDYYCMILETIPSQFGDDFFTTFIEKINNPEEKLRKVFFKLIVNQLQKNCILSKDQFSQRIQQIKKLMGKKVDVNSLTLDNIPLLFSAMIKGSYYNEDTIKELCVSTGLSTIVVDSQGFGFFVYRLATAHNNTTIKSLTDLFKNFTLNISKKEWKVACLIMELKHFEELLNDCLLNIKEFFPSRTENETLIDPESIKWLVETFKFSEESLIKADERLRNRLDDSRIKYNPRHLLEAKTYHESQISAADREAINKLDLNKEILELWAAIDFTKTERRWNQKDKMWKGFNRLITAIEEKRVGISTPPENQPEALNRYYSDIKEKLREILFYKRHPETGYNDDEAFTIVDGIAQATQHCPGAWVDEIRSQALGLDKGGMPEVLCSKLIKVRIQIIKEWANITVRNSHDIQENERAYVPEGNEVHLGNAVIHKHGDVYGIPDHGKMIDRFEIITEDQSKGISEYFNEKYTFSTIYSALEELIQDSQKHEIVMDWMKEELVGDWEKEKYENSCDSVLEIMKKSLSNAENSLNKFEHFWDKISPVNVSDENIELLLHSIQQRKESFRNLFEKREISKDLLIKKLEELVKSISEKLRENDFFAEQVVDEKSYKIKRSMKIKMLEKLGIIKITSS